MQWHEKHSRHFTFRNVDDAYLILVSEILLRKTTARQVNSIWPEFVKKFPTPLSLMKADRRELEHFLAPLGIRTRAQQLKEIARIIVDEWQGKVPCDLRKLMKLPGVGEYIASCVVAFRCNVKLPLIDSNVRRVLSRLLASAIRKLSQKEASELVKRAYLELVPDNYIRKFHYALLDLAATICRPKKQRCNICPILLYCSYARHHNIN